ncbi:MAG TPA: hypothetical protein VK826_18005 [Bacteroidia bacterium]|nr:hypothetical protein [Bacteroidia bacterium]
MKKLFLFLILCVSIADLAAQQRDTIVIVQPPDTVVIAPPVYFTVIGIGTEHAQIAAIGNIAPDKFSGVQIAGVFNVGKGSMSGVQIAGVNNHASDSLTGAQIAGCINTVHGNVRGIQMAGAINATDRNVYGAQLAGAVNVAAGDVGQFQAAGGLNYAHNVQGLQASGGANIASGTVTGMQISGGLNYAHNLKGLQIGVFNFADSADGVMIGVFSFARHGYHKIEIGWNETTPLNFSFRTGSTRFHNIFSLVTDFREREIVWGFGYGMGTSWPVHKRVDIGVDLVNYHISRGEFSTSLSDLWKFNITADLHLVKNLSLAVGPSLNVFVTDLNPDGNEVPVTGIAPYYFFTQTYHNRWNAKAWIGVNVSLRFF